MNPILDPMNEFARENGLPHADDEVGHYAAMPAPGYDDDRPKPPDVNGKPSITLPGGRVSITACAEKLYPILAASRELFLRGNTVVSLQLDSDGEMRLEPVKPHAARSLFEKSATFLVWRVGRGNELVLKPTVMPCDTAQALLDCHVAGDTLPPITGLSNCAVLTEVDGELVLCGKGYSRDTGLLIRRGDTPPEVPLEEAVAALKKLNADFDFQTAGDESRAMGSFIAPALKMGGLIHGYVPCDVAEADQSQSGKTYRQRMVAAVYDERLAIVPLKKGGVGGTDESLSEKLIAGRPFIQFDNFRGDMDSPTLEAFLTAEHSFPCRVPHQREINVDPRRFFVMLSSNGVESTRDFANRSCIIRIFKRRDVSFPDTLQRIREQQPFYLGCVFAIVREWHLRGKRRSADTRHDFREWCQILDYIVQHICGLAPLMDGHVQAQERVSNPTLTFVRKIAIAVEHGDRLGEPLTASQIFEIAVDEDIAVPGVKPHGQQDEGLGRKVIGSKLAKLFKDAGELELDGYTVTRSEEERSRDGGGTYTGKFYTFARPMTGSAQGAQGALDVQPQGKTYGFPDFTPSSAASAKTTQTPAGTPWEVK